MKTAVIYGTKHGTTKQYAEWIADELNADLFNHEAFKAKQLNAYDLIVYGGGLYAGGIIGVKLVSKNMPKNLVVFTVGLADPKETDYSEIIDKAFKKQQQEQIKVFHLRGGIDYGKLGFMHKTMMAMVKKSIVKKPVEKRSSEDTAILETYGQKLDFLDIESIKPLVEYVKNMN